MGCTDQDEIIAALRQGAAEKRGKLEAEMNLSLSLTLSLSLYIYI